MPTLNHQVIQAAIEGLESRKSAIDEQIVRVRELLNGGGAKPAATPTRTGGRQISAAARKRMSAAQRRRWAAKRAGAPLTAAPAAAKRAKRRLSPEGRRRIIAATKKRWAAVRAAAKRAK